MCDKLKTINFPGHIVNLIDFLRKNIYFFTSYEGCLSDEWTVCEVRQWGVTSGTVFNFYTDEV